MKIGTFLMLIKGEVLIPSLKTLQHTDPVEARLPSRVYPAYVDFHDALKQGEGFKWVLSKAQKWERDFIEKHTDSLIVKVWLRELAIRRSIWCWYAKRTESRGMWNNYRPHGIAVVFTIAVVRRAF